jgi:excisionase family DNA binding protein
MTNDFNPTEWITTAEAAELTGYDVTHIRLLVRKGSITGRKFGRDWMIDRESVKDYAEEMKRLGLAKYDPWRTGAREKTSP